MKKGAFCILVLLGVVLVVGCAEDVKTVDSDRRWCPVGGWPANSGVWIWKNEILVGFHQADYVPTDCGHSIGGKGRSLLARSIDGGQTWAVEDADNFVGDGGAAVACPGNIDFAHPDFAMRCSDSEFFISYDRGRTLWFEPAVNVTNGLPRQWSARLPGLLVGQRAERGGGGAGQGILRPDR
ncbi:MAG: hypothetical protein ACYS8I_15980 [Planctomycetota bacterium]